MAAAERDYTVTGQNPTRRPVGGQMTDVWEINYVGPNSISGAVVVPQATATPDLVDELIRAQLDRQLAIARLGSRTG